MGAARLVRVVVVVAGALRRNHRVGRCRGDRGEPSAAARPVPSATGPIRRQRHVVGGRWLVGDRGFDDALLLAPVSPALSGEDGDHRDHAQHHQHDDDCQRHAHLRVYPLYGIDNRAGQRPSNRAGAVWSTERRNGAPRRGSAAAQFATARTCSAYG